MIGERALNTAPSSNGGALKPGRLKEREVRRVPPIGPARDVALRNGRGKTRRLTDHPVRQQAAAAAAGHAQLLLVDVAALNHLIDAGHQIFVIVARIMVLNDVAEFLAVGRAAARIRIEHHVTLRRHPLKLMLENVAVGRVRSAMNVRE